MAKFTKSPIQSFDAEAAEEAEGSALDTVMGFVENDALFAIMITVIVIFLGFQFGRWALNRDWGDPEDENQEEERLR